MHRLASLGTTCAILTLTALVAFTSCSDDETVGAGGTTAADAGVGGQGGEPPDATSSGDGGGGAGGSPIPIPLIGPRPVAPTPADAGTIVAAPNGSGTACTLAEPCDLWEAIDQAQAGDVAFLRGGVYDIADQVRFGGDGTASEPIVFESYPGELAILDGSGVAVGESITIRLNGSFYVLRLIEIRNMPRQGLLFPGTDNLVEGLHVHHNHLSGMQISSSYDQPYGAEASRNTIRDSVTHDNFDEGTSIPDFANGGNADGISISNGTENRVEHCLVYLNSDDGIDTWRSTDSYVGYSISHSNGIADGNANGIKAGGLEPSARTFVEHCIAYANLANGIDYNSGAEVTFSFNTTFQNNRGFWLGDDTVAEYNIASGDVSGDVNSAGTQTDNSWQRDGTVEFVSEDPSSPDFLRPTPNGGFADIGAYAGL